MTWQWILRGLEFIGAVAALRQSVKLYVLGNAPAAYYALLVSALFMVLVFKRNGLTYPYGTGKGE